MAFFAKTVDGIVTKVISAKVSFFDTFIDTSPGKWLETFTDGTRMNYAEVGFTYDSTRDAFIAPPPPPPVLATACPGSPPLALLGP